MASKGRPYRRFEVAGFEVLVGRGDAENERLTFRVAEPHDLWLHVGGGTPGSHVVVKNPDRAAIPREVIEAAAALAAWYSKAKSAAKVDVHYCRVADVKKPRGAPAGLVELVRHQRIRVRPAIPDSEPDSG
jgi:predicted ribosome quality control (RQC) complex YloA/Tae2 family protein